MTTFRLEVPLRWVDQDAQGHVNNALIVDYLQEARVAFMLNGPNAHILDGECVVVSHRVEFLRPVVFDLEPVVVELSVGRVRAAQVTFGYDVLHRGELVARARSVVPVVNPETGAPRRLTAGERSWFESWSTQVEPLRELGRWRVGERAYESDFHVRWSDLDPYGHVNNVRMFDIVAEARIRMNPGDQTRTRMDEALSQGLRWMVARQDVKYRAPIQYRLAPYRVRTAYARVGNTSMTLAAEVLDPASGTVHARSLTVLVCGDDQGRPVPVPAGIAAGLDLWPAVQLA